MNILHNLHLNLRDCLFHDALLGVSNGKDTIPERLQAVILNVILNTPNSTQVTIPLFQCRDINGEELVFDESHNNVLTSEDCDFHKVPQTVHVSWNPYGVVEMQKVKEILNEEVETRLFRPDIVRKTVQYGWQFRWDCNFAERIICDAKQFALRGGTHLQEKLQRNAKSWSDNHDYICVEILNDYIRFSSWGSGSSYIIFKDEGLVNLNNAIQVLGCAYAVLECFGNSHEWEIFPYYKYESGRMGIRCSLKGHRKTALKQW